MKNLIYLCLLSFSVHTAFSQDLSIDQFHSKIGGNNLGYLQHVISHNGGKLY